MVPNPYPDYYTESEWRNLFNDFKEQYQGSDFTDEVILELVKAHVVTARCGEPLHTKIKDVPIRSTIPADLDLELIRSIRDLAWRTSVEELSAELDLDYDLVYGVIYGSIAPEVGGALQVKNSKGLCLYTLRRRLNYEIVRFAREVYIQAFSSMSFDMFERLANQNGHDVDSLSNVLNGVYYGKGYHFQRSRIQESFKKSKNKGRQK